MSDPGKAVFLSYASQDAEAAKRICEALRAAGVEVWFDQSELVGGDAWDQKIRKQIKECALLIPIISANTQARTEGYFRLEWRLADQRTHLMAKGRPFLLPVVIDDTRDSEAQVPDSFTEVQWTRLKGGAGAEKFAERVKKLLSGGGTSSPSTPLGTLSPSKGRESVSLAPIPASQELSPPRKTGKRWLIPAILGVVAITAIAFWLVRKPAANVVHETPEPRPQTQNPPPAVPPTEARQLVERARGLMDKVNALPGDLITAAGLLEQAAKLAPNDALVWSTWALLDLRYVSLDFDNTPSRHNAARSHVARANALDPTSRETRYTQAEVMRSLAWDPATQAAAEKILRPMLTEAPEDGRVPIQLGWVAFAQGRLDDAVALFDRAAMLPAFAVHATYCKALVLGLRNHFEASDRALDQLLVLAPTHAFGLCQKAANSLYWHGDLEAARNYIERVPPQMRVEDMSAAFAYGVYMTRREYDLAVKALRAVPRDYLSAQPGPGPSGFYIGEALAAAGKNAAAEIERRSALAIIERRLAEAPSDEALMKFKALLLARLGDRAAAERVWKAVVELHGDRAWGNLAPLLHVVFLPPDEAIAWLNGRFEDPQFWFTAGSLRFSPVYDPLRSNPQFTALVEKMEADPRFSPKAVPAPSSLLPSPSARPEVEPKSVAVLAFANLSDDKANEYFSDGISEELLNVLAKVPGLKVSARTSSFHFKGKDTPIAEIAQKLGVAYVVEGSVRKQGDKVRITAQLVKAADGFHVWSDTFTRDLKDIFAVQDEIAALVAQNLQLKLGVSKAQDPVDPEVFQLYLESRRAWSRRTFAAMDEAEQLLTRALDRAPGFARGLAAMADVWWFRGHEAYNDPQKRSQEALLRTAETWLDRALSVDPNLAEAHATRGGILSDQGNFRDAENALRRALELNPNYATARQWYGGLLCDRGEFTSGLRELEMAVQLDPFAPMISSNHGMYLCLARRYADSLAAFDRVLAMAPGFAQALGWRPVALYRLGRREEAIPLLRERLSVLDTTGTPGEGTFNHLVLLAESGAKGEAVRWFDRLLAASPEVRGMPAELIMALGRKEEALTRLAGSGSEGIVQSLLDPVWDQERESAEFLQVMEKTGVTAIYRQAWTQVQALQEKPSKP